MRGATVGRCGCAVRGQITLIVKVGERFVEKWNRRGIRVWALVGILTLALTIFGANTFSTSRAPAARAAGCTATSDWSTYLYNTTRSGYNGIECQLGASNAPNWQMLWSSKNYLALTAQTVEATVGGTERAYMGGWDGYERALPFIKYPISPPDPLWSTYLGRSNAICHPYLYGNNPGVASTPTVTMVNNTPMLFVGGGGDGPPSTASTAQFVHTPGQVDFYALNPVSGAVIWHTPLGSSPEHFIWSSPAVFAPTLNGVVQPPSIYIGVASTADCPMVRGQLFKLDAATGAIQNVFNVVPNGCTGGEIWDAPTIDAYAPVPEEGATTHGTVYIATGNAGSCSHLDPRTHQVVQDAEPYAESVIELSAASLAVRTVWQVPASQRVPNGGFRSTPTLFQYTIPTHPTVYAVGIANKNGIYYAFGRAALNNGPLWQRQIARGGGCVNFRCTAGSVAPSAFDGSALYVAGGATNTGCTGTIQKLDPATGNPIWVNCRTDGVVICAVTVFNSNDRVVVVGAGPDIVGMAASNGAQLYLYHDPENMDFPAPASVSNGLFYHPNIDGGLHAEGL